VCEGSRLAAPRESSRRTTRRRLRLRPRELGKRSCNGAALGISNPRRHAHSDDSRCAAGCEVVHARRRGGHSQWRGGGTNGRWVSESEGRPMLRARPSTDDDAAHTVGGASSTATAALAFAHPHRVMRLHCEPGFGPQTDPRVAGCVGGSIAWGRHKGTRREAVVVVVVFAVRTGSSRWSQHGRPCAMMKPARAAEQQQFSPQPHAAVDAARR
jgi:hypothetical protein